MEGIPEVTEDLADRETANLVLHHHSSEARGCDLVHDADAISICVLCWLLAFLWRCPSLLVLDILAAPGLLYFYLPVYLFHSFLLHVHVAEVEGFIEQLDGSFLAYSGARCAVLILVRSQRGDLGRRGRLLLLEVCRALPRARRVVLAAGRRGRVGL